ncbi:MAG: hypothetical protein LBG08_08830 [Spirochaetaceae bacterium]|jgi:hypothetical protein|nr:hypothetical protein [Spirochaetaceae bacterium]
MRTLQQKNQLKSKEAAPKTEFPEQPQSSLVRIDYLRKKIDNKDYLYGGIQRIAQILSDELLNIPQGGAWYEQQR